VALIGGRADDGIVTRASASLTGIGLGALVVVVAGRAVGLGRIGANTGVRITGAGVVTLIGGGANNRIGTGAGTRLTGVGLGALVTVVARRAIVLGRVRTIPGSRVADAGLMTLIESRADDRIGASARSRLASVCLGTKVAIVAGCPVRFDRVGANTGVRVTGADIVTLVDSSLSSQGVLSAFGGSEQMPVSGSQVPALWHWSDAVQTTGSEPVQVPV